MEKTFKWFTTADLSKYEDKYVSIVEEQVVCADEDPEDFHHLLKYVEFIHARWPWICPKALLGIAFIKNNHK